MFSSSLCFKPRYYRQKYGHRAVHDSLSQYACCYKTLPIQLRIDTRTPEDSA